MTEICVEGETLVLDHRRALYWPSRSALVIADSHFGKSAIFRREGIALPEGSDQDDLVILGSLIDEYSPAHLCILGDFVHGALPAGHTFYSRFNHWRAAHPGVELHIVALLLG